MRHTCRSVFAIATGADRRRLSSTEVRLASVGRSVGRAASLWAFGLVAPRALHAARSTSSGSPTTAPSRGSPAPSGRSSPGWRSRLPFALGGLRRRPAAAAGRALARPPCSRRSIHAPLARLAVAVAAPRHAAAANGGRLPRSRYAPRGPPSSPSVDLGQAAPRAPPAVTRDPDRRRGRSICMTPARLIRRLVVLVGHRLHRADDCRRGVRARDPGRDDARRTARRSTVRPPASLLRFDEPVETVSGAVRVFDASAGQLGSGRRRAAAHRPRGRGRPPRRAGAPGTYTVAGASSPRTPIRSAGRSCSRSGEPGGCGRGRRRGGARRGAGLRGVSAPAQAVARFAALALVLLCLGGPASLLVSGRTGRTSSDDVARRPRRFARSRSRDARLDGRDRREALGLGPRGAGAARAAAGGRRHVVRAGVGRTDRARARRWPGSRRSRSPAGSAEHARLRGGGRRRRARGHLPALGPRARGGRVRRSSSDATHAAAAGAWVGGLAVLGLSLVTAGGDRRSVSSAPSRRSPRVALVAVAVLLATGIVNASSSCPSSPRSGSRPTGGSSSRRARCSSCSSRRARLQRRVALPRLRRESSGCRAALSPCRRGRARCDGGRDRGHDGARRRAAASCGDGGGRVGHLDRRRARPDAHGRPGPRGDERDARLRPRPGNGQPASGGGDRRVGDAPVGRGSGRSHSKPTPAGPGHVVVARGGVPARRAPGTSVWTSAAASSRSRAPINRVTIRKDI